MAKRNIDKPGTQDTKAPERRRRSTTSSDAAGTTPIPKTRARRKTDVTQDAAAAQADVAPVADVTAPTPITAEAEVVTSPVAPASSTASTPGKPGNGHAHEVQVPHEHIALRAYHLYLQRGGRAGDQFLDWLTAERELREQFARATS